MILQVRVNLIIYLRIKAKAKGEGKEAVGDDTAADNAWHATSFDICSLHSSFLVMRRHHVIVS